MIRTSVAASSALALLVASQGAQALNIEYGAGLRSEYSTNVIRSEDAEGDLLTEAWGGVHVQERSARWEGQIAAVAGYENYLDGVVEDDVEFALAALTDITLLPQRLSWHIEDYYQQVRVSMFEPEGPDNEQNSNVLWTGPDLHLRIAQLYELDIGARYGDYYYGETLGDNQRLALYERLTRRLSDHSEIYLVGEQMEVEYETTGTRDVRIPSTLDEDGFPMSVPLTLEDFNREDLFLGYAYESPLTDLRIEGGASRIGRDNAPDIDGSLLGLSITRRLSPQSQLSLDVTRRYSESGEALLDSGGFRLDPDLSTDTTVEDIVQEQRVALSYTSGVEGLSFGIRAFGLDEEYQTIELLDRRVVGLGAQRSWRIRPTWVMTVDADARQTEYRELDIEDRDYQLSARAVHRLNRRLSIELGAAANRRTSTHDDRDFTEYVGMISLRYGERPAWSER